MTQPSLRLATDNTYFEDYQPGLKLEYGSVEISEAEILTFAKRFDTQYFHTDPEKAAKGPFEGLIASGWHTAGLMMRLYADNYISKVAGLGSPGVDDLRWTKPVRAGDVLKIQCHILETQPLKSKPDRGMVRTSINVLNQRDEVVMHLSIVNFFRCRPKTHKAG